MKQFPSILMHMMVLGIEKLLISKTKMLVNRRNTAENQIWHELTDSMNTTLAAVEEASLDWCMPMTFSNNNEQTMGTSKWQSDHLLSFTRLSLWFHFGHLDKDTGLLAGKKIFAAFKRVRVVWFCLMSSILADEDVDAARIDDLVKLFLSSCRNWWTAATDKLSGGEVDSSQEPTRKRKAGSGTGGKAKKKTAREKASSKDTTKERKSDGAAPTKRGKKKASSKDSTKNRKSDGAAPTTVDKKKSAKKRKKPHLTKNNNQQKMQVSQRRRRLHSSSLDPII